MRTIGDGAGDVDRPGASLERRSATIKFVEIWRWLIRVAGGFLLAFLFAWMPQRFQAAYSQP